jgi:isopentenyl-diphosphate Delta-isomerase
MPELVDIRDEQGKLTGVVMPRPDAHRTESWHGIAQVWVYNTKGDILLQLRAAHLNAFPERWDVTVSGHLTAGDEPVQTAVRELGEELGINAEAESLEAAGMVADSFPLVYGKIHRECDYVFLLCKDVEADDMTYQAAEVLDTRWITPDELERDLADPVASRHYTTRDAIIFHYVIEAARRQQAKAPQV